jgi:hypothetical protein
MQGLDWINEDPKGWIMSEKLDGVRAYWDGAQFWSKRGSYFFLKMLNKDNTNINKPR